MSLEKQIGQMIASTEILGAKVLKALEHYNQADPMEPYIGPDGELWNPVGITSSLMEGSAPYVDEAGLTMARRICRTFAKDNPFAINGHENRVSYVIGYGHQYKIIGKFRKKVSEDTIQKVQEVVDEFLKVNRWSSRQSETLLRTDRDGEAFLRFFSGYGDGILRVRYVEPHAVASDPGETSPHKSYGITTDQDDHETVLSYRVEGEEVEASEIQHRKRGTSENKRGVPVFFAVRHNLVRALKVLRNGSTITEIQTSIGLIRKFMRATGATVQAWAVTKSQDDTGTPDEGETKPLAERFKPGTIINTNGQTEYEFPAMAVDPSKYVESLQAELRAIAACLVMTESMFSAKTDDSSRAAGEVAEGPVLRNFERLQQTEATYDLEVLDKALDVAVDEGRISQEERNSIEIEVSPPPLNVRDPAKEAERRKSDMDAGLLSPQTASGEAGYDYETEQENIERHQEKKGKVSGASLPTDFLKMMGKETPPNPDPNNPDPNNPDPNDPDPNDPTQNGGASK